MGDVIQVTFGTCRAKPATLPASVEISAGTALRNEFAHATWDLLQEDFLGVAAQETYEREKFAFRYGAAIAEHVQESHPNSDMHPVETAAIAAINSALKYAERQIGEDVPVCDMTRAWQRAITGMAIRLSDIAAGQIAAAHLKATP